MATVSVGRVVIAVSPDGRADWKLLKPGEAPDWLKDEDVMGKMLDGHVAHDYADPAAPWYCAVKIPDRPGAEGNAILPAPTKTVIVPPSAIELPENPVEH